MAPLQLQLKGSTLGSKHRQLNELARAASHTVQTSEGDDLRQLLNIEVASKHRNVQYILRVLTSEDELLVSQALRRSVWLLTEPQYAHIINPGYVFRELQPQMTARALNKLMLQIRLHLRDEKRVEAFYNYVKEKDQSQAFKWLQHCSVPFVCTEVAKHHVQIPTHLVLRLFEKSVSIFETFHNKQTGWVQESQFVAKNHTEIYLTTIEKNKYGYHEKFTPSITSLLLSKYSERILQNIDYYSDLLHLPTFANYINRTENITDFLNNHYKDVRWQRIFTYNKIRHFLKLMPKDTRFDFVKKIFIDQDIAVDTDETLKDVRSDDRPAIWCDDYVFHNHTYTSTNILVYQWYELAPFEVALKELREVLASVSASDQRTLILKVILSSAGNNTQHIQTVLQYYFDKHINEPFKFKINFVNTFISKVDTHALDDKSWSLLNQIFHSIEVYIESENSVQACVRAIIVRNTIRHEPIPEIIEKKFVFDTLSIYKKKLKIQEERDAVFKYLQNYLTTKKKSLDLNVEAEFRQAVALCEQFLNLIKEWDKQLSDFPKVLTQIKTLVSIKKEKQWKIDMTSLYNMKKAWRRELFDVSIDLMHNEAACVNVLKHDPELLSRNRQRVLEMAAEGTVSLKNLFRKMRIYWPGALSEAWKKECLQRLNDTKQHKAAINGLCTLMSQKEVKELLKTYAPAEAKIDWSETDQSALSIRKHLAQNVHKARPLPPLEEVLLYAKGDYLQYAVPSLSSILSQLSPLRCRLYVRRLLNAPVSLQKFGIRSVFQKLTFDELKPMLSEMWNSNKNSSIRTILFIHTHELLCKERNESHIEFLWQLLSTFIDSLTDKENEKIYKTLSDVSKLPDSAKPKFFMKSYSLLCTLPNKCYCESILSSMFSHVDNILPNLDDTFVTGELLKDSVKKIIKKSILDYEALVIVKFILASKDKETQLRRYEMVFAPILEECLPKWDTVTYDTANQNNEYRVKTLIRSLLQTFSTNVTFCLENKMQIPTEIFQRIQKDLEKTLAYERNYTILKSWKMITDFTEALAHSETIRSYYLQLTDDGQSKEEKHEQTMKILSQLLEELLPVFGKMCVQYLKEDLNKIGNSAPVLFADTLNTFFNEYAKELFQNSTKQLDYVMWILRNETSTAAWLAVAIFLQKRRQFDCESTKLNEIRDIVFSPLCPSVEVKMHFYKFFAYDPFTTDSAECNDVNVE